MSNFSVLKFGKEEFTLHVLLRKKSNLSKKATRILQTINDNNKKIITLTSSIEAEIAITTYRTTTKTIQTYSSKTKNLYLDHLSY